MGSASEQLRKRDRFIRLELVGVTACWVGLAIANLAVSDHIRWYPDVVGGFAAVTALCTIILVLVPTTVFAFRFGGALAIGTLVMRCVSIIEGFALGLEDDFVWLGLAAFCITAMLTGSYWRWWLSDIKQWHETHKLAGRRR